MRREDVAILEELNVNAWPALRAVHYDGWLLRCTGGESRRVNSVNPLAPGVIPLAEKIATAQAIYARWGRSAVFRLTPLADPRLDEMLAARGLVVEAPTFVQTAEIAGRGVPEGARVFARPDRAWVAAAIALRGLTGEAAAAFAAQHQAVGIESGWAMIAGADGPVAVGVVAIERGWAGLHGIYVAKVARRRGLALRISEALLNHSFERGARKAWLQVEQTNAAALPLYAGLGFQTAYRYHHRVQSDKARPKSGATLQG
jgi:ribosomal protein S18 acetylase RimI-like enzyme